MLEINFDDERLYYADDVGDAYLKEDKESLIKRGRYFINEMNESRYEKEFKSQWNFTDREDVILWDEFGRTDAPNPLIDCLQYFIDERYSVFNRTENFGRKNNKTGELRVTVKEFREAEQFHNLNQRYPNPALEVQIRKEQCKRRILNHILLGTKNIIKENKDLMKGLHLRILQEVSLVYLRWLETPCNQTLKDWKGIKKREDRKEYIRIMFDILDRYVIRIKTTWEI